VLLLLLLLYLLYPSTANRLLQVLRKQVHLQPSIRLNNMDVTPLHTYNKVEWVEMIPQYTFHLSTDCPVSMWIFHTTVEYTSKSETISQLGSKNSLKTCQLRDNIHGVAFYPQKLALTSPTSGERSVGMVRSPTIAAELSVGY
jgi:hypothetical protein